MKFKTTLISGGVAIALPLIIGVYRVWPRSDNSEWQIAADVAPPGLMMQIATDNLAPAFDAQLGQMKMLRPWQSGQTKALYIIDSRTADLTTQDNPLCGALGCAFFGYIPTENGFQNVFSVYLDPHLPPNVQLLEASDELHQEMPELVIHQLENDQLLQLRLVLNDEQYEVVETQYLPQKDE